MEGDHHGNVKNVMRLEENQSSSWPLSSTIRANKAEAKQTEAGKSSSDTALLREGDLLLSHRADLDMRDVQEE